MTLKGGSFPEGTVAVFGICAQRDAKTVFSKVFDVNDNSIVIRLTNAETRKLAVNTYRWDLRIVTDPEFNDDGSVRCDDDSDNVLSVYSGVGMPSFVVTEVSVYV